MIDHCIAAFNAKRKTEIYRSYITDCAYVIANGLFGRDTISGRFADIISTSKKEESKDAEEMINERLKKFGIEVVWSDGCIRADGAN